MTHNKELPYMDYIRIIRENPRATKVKLADLEHNSNLSRMQTRPQKTMNVWKNTKKQELFFCDSFHNECSSTKELIISLLSSETRPKY